MLTKHEKFHFLDEANKHNFFVEVNFKEDDKETNECKIFKFIFPDGSESFIRRKHLLEMFFACGKPEDQRNMIPQIIETVHHYRTVLGIKATKDIQKGEMINFPIDLSIPCGALRQDVIDSLPKEYRKGKLGNGR